MTSGQGRWLAAVTVLPKTGVNDPEGEAILGGLHQLGYDSVARVGAGRLFHLTLNALDEASARDLATKMSEQLLSNPVIEQFSVEVSPL